MFEQAFEKPRNKMQQMKEQGQGKRKYKLKEAGREEQQQQQGGDQKVYRDSVTAIRTVNSPLVEYKDFEEKLHMVFDQTQYEKFSELK